jgi:transcriptional regulator with AAA-type ATPase domain
MAKISQGWFSPEDRRFAQAVARVNAANPFLPERIAAEREALGDAFVEAGADWNTRPPVLGPHVNSRLIAERCAMAMARVREAVRAGAKPAGADAVLHEEVAGYWLYHTYSASFDRAILAALEGRGEGGRVEFFAAFRTDFDACFQAPLGEAARAEGAAHWFACAFQIRRAFHNIFRYLVGGARPMARLRAEIWQSIFTHDLRRYRRTLFARLGDFATLINGPSGTGKELVARALALSRYLPYEARRAGFGRDFSQGFFALNLAALSPTLIESELFGHRRGAFTGALGDRAGWMEECPSTGAVFLDEIGEVEAGIQVKLLRVLQTRTFQPLGGTETRRFEGKIIAATNRDLPAEIRAGRFREDFYYRLCSDQIATPTLRSQLDDRPEDLATMVEHIAGRTLAADEVAAFTRQAVDWIGGHLGADYAWPGNFRELEQCVRNLILRGAYRPAAPARGAGEEDLPTALAEGRLTAEEVLRRYTRSVFARTGTIKETARLLDVDRRTVRARLEPAACVGDGAGAKVRRRRRPRGRSRS